MGRQINHLSHPNLACYDCSYSALGKEPFPYELLQVHAPLDPPFTVVHHVPGEGDTVQGVDVSHELGAFGVWQPNGVLGWRHTQMDEFLEGLPGAGGLLLLRKTVVDVGGGAGPQKTATVAGLGLVVCVSRHFVCVSHHCDTEGGGTVVDVGASYGMFSLSAAARGLQVAAFESLPRSAQALAASIKFNAFEARMKLYTEKLSDDAPLQAVLGALTSGKWLRQSTCNILNV